MKPGAPHAGGQSGMQGCVDQLVKTPAGWPACHDFDWEIHHSTNTTGRAPILRSRASGAYHSPS
jgi:hypothetical protein